MFHTVCSCTSIKLWYVPWVVPPPTLKSNWEYLLTLESSLYYHLPSFSILPAYLISMRVVWSYSRSCYWLQKQSLCLLCFLFPLGTTVKICLKLWMRRTKFPPISWSVPTNSQKILSKIFKWTFLSLILPHEIRAAFLKVFASLEFIWFSSLNFWRVELVELVHQSFMKYGVKN